MPPEHKCAKCGATETPVWRRSKNRDSYLCNACGLRENKPLQPSQRPVRHNIKSILGKDRARPKRPKSAFIVFCMGQRRILQDRNRSLTFGQTSAILSRTWNSMPNSQKLEYIVQAKADEERYHREKREYELMNMLSGSGVPIMSTEISQISAPRAFHHESNIYNTYIPGTPPPSSPINAPAMMSSHSSFSLRPSFIWPSGSSIYSVSKS